MSLTIVNGYACADCADIAKAKRGENPNAKPGDVDPKAAKAKADAGVSETREAVTFGGSLAASRIDGAQPAAGASVVGRTLDIRA